MATLYSGFDAFWYPMRLGNPLDASTTRLRLIGQDFGGTVDAYFEDGLYTTVNWAEEVEGLFYWLRQNVSSALGSTFFERVDMTAEDGTVLPGWGLRIRCSPQPFSIDTDDEESAAALRILGFEPGSGLIGSEPEGLDHVIYSPKPWGLCWRSPKTSQSKLSNQIQDQHISGGRGQSIQLTRWGSDQLRLFRYDEIPAAHIREGRADIEAFAEVASLPVGATTNAFSIFWQDGISRYVPIFAGYHLDGAIPDDWDSIEHREVLRSPIESRYADELERCLTRSRRSAEHYSVEFALRVESSTWRQG